MKPGRFKYYTNFILILIWLIISTYICIGGLSIIEATEKVKLIEKKVGQEIITEVSLVQHNTKEELYEEIDQILAKINLAYKVNSKDSLRFEDKKEIRDLGHVYWYYGFPGYSAIRFLTIMPYFVLLFLTVGAAGAMGSASRIIIDHARKEMSIEDSMCLTMPMFGFIMGIVVLAISYIIPSIFINGDTNLNTTAVVLICFFSGIFTNKFYEWITRIIENFLKSKQPS